MSGEIQKWADEAMFRAEPSKASDGPKVYMLAGTPDPLGSVAAFSAMYTGKVIRSKDQVTREDRLYHLEQMQQTKLKAPLEAVNIHFMIEGVTRSFTHQMVRQRTAVYAQESLRFAVKEDAADAVALPPSLAGTMSTAEWEESVADEDGMISSKSVDFASDEQRMRLLWDDTVRVVSKAYNQLVNMGMPAEDARGLLPHSITTRLNYATNLRSLQDHAGNRLCTQAQFEWRLVWARIIEAMRNYCSESVHSGFRRPQQHGQSSVPCDNWQWQEIAKLFKPVCYLTGKCEFGAEFDRKCSIRERVQLNAEIGRPSSEWHERLDRAGQTIRPIRPEEWLLDPGAAR